MNKQGITGILTMAFAALLLNACSVRTDLFEKNIPIPDHNWSKSFKPEISVNIEDTASRYIIYAVVRHQDAYRYKNLYLNIAIQSPTGETATHMVDLKLATDEKGWLGSGMDDIFEHRIQITPAGTLHAGAYKFTLQQMMREDPLEHVMNAGIRIAKVP
ncbi:gliding motility lipoprotein GldH [Pseudoflavitalea sp. G-6-1-2]|uniref:gliding motility lipoprotein GldH n=1 Tax=Pseudoflavitalea sp. G-6-1-2 TaxID=2728841 RepID=UPI00146A85F1|nr:gliding motility lipoprotein GldH [Pseudoflavitalea sp. G-6-1-2]NML19713.1 gliding motility lipoprotein GldH [Pseudoflavitalea sp. G-6-1-2]